MSPVEYNLTRNWCLFRRKISIRLLHRFPVPLRNTLLANIEYSLNDLGGHLERFAVLTLLSKILTSFWKTLHSLEVRPHRGSLMRPDTQRNYSYTTKNGIIVASATSSWQK